jgi:plasmid stabilization system protein ParE
MIHAVELLAIAEADLGEAKEWYRRCHPHLEADLILCVEETLERITRRPLSFAVLKGDFHQAFVHRFPYRIVFRMVAERIVVVAILHTSRHPRTWIARDH